MWGRGRRRAIDHGRCGGTVSYTHLDVYKRQDYTDPDFIAHMEDVYTNIKNSGIRSLFFDYAGQYHGTSGGYLLDKTGGFEDPYATAAVSYTHLDVYKRQGYGQLYPGRGVPDL